jgi:hypothetical protein
MKSESYRFSFHSKDSGDLGEVEADDVTRSKGNDAVIVSNKMRKKMKRLGQTVTDDEEGEEGGGAGVGAGSGAGVSPLPLPFPLPHPKRKGVSSKKRNLEIYFTRDGDQFRCAVCGKSFPQLRAIQQHVHQVCFSSPQNFHSTLFLSLFPFLDARIEEMWGGVVAKYGEKYPVRSMRENVPFHGVTTITFDL